MGPLLIQRIDHPARQFGIICHEQRLIVPSGIERGHILRRLGLHQIGQFLPCRRGGNSRIRRVTFKIRLCEDAASCRECEHGNRAENR